MVACESPPAMGISPWISWIFPQLSENFHFLFERGPAQTMLGKVRQWGPHFSGAWKGWGGTGHVGPFITEQRHLFSGGQFLGVLQDELPLSSRDYIHIYRGACFQPMNILWGRCTAVELHTSKSRCPGNSSFHDDTKLALHFCKKHRPPRWWWMD